MTKKTFLRSGNTIHVQDAHTVDAYDHLPAGTYTVKFNEQTREFFLEQIGDFDLPDKIYGKSTGYAERILQTFNERPGSTGVLLSGIKGAGKTLLAKQTALLAREQGVPTIVINKEWHGDEFNAFIQSINTPTIIMFDEFEKVYGYYEQRKVLTLFDGVYPSRKLFMVTTNTEKDVSEYLQNRPGRIYYNFQFDTLEQDFIEEFLNDRLEDKSQIPSILKYTQVFSFFNFDMLNAAVEEMNRFGETLPEVLEVLNIQPENRAADTFRMELVFNGKNFLVDRNYSNFRPNSFEWLLWTDDEMPKELAKDKEAAKAVTEMAGGGASSDGLSALLGGGGDYITFSPQLLKSFDQQDNRFVYSVERDGRVLELHVTRNDPLKQWTYNPNAF